MWSFETRVVTGLPSVPAGYATSAAQTSLTSAVAAIPTNPYTGTPPTTGNIATAVAAAILSNPGNLLVTDAGGKIGINNLPIEFLSSTEQAELTNAITDLNSLLGRNDASGSVNTVLTNVNVLLSRLSQAILFDVSGNVKSAPQTLASGAATLANQTSLIAAVGSPMQASSYVAPNNSGIATCISDLAALIARNDTSGSIAAIKATTDELASMIVAGVFTESSLINAPSGGGSSSVGGNITTSTIAAILGVEPLPAPNFNIFKGVSISQAWVSDTGSLNSTDKLYFTASTGMNLPDSFSTIQAYYNGDGASSLTVLNRAAASSNQSLGTLTFVNNSPGYTITLQLAPQISSSISATLLYFDIKRITSTGDESYLINGQCKIIPTVTKATS